MSAFVLSWLLVSCFAAPEADPVVDDPNTNPEPLEQDPGIAEPSAEPSSSEPAPEGGFGSVGTVTTDSNVAAPPPPPTEEEDEGPRREMSLRAEAGYGQANLGNAEGLDHQGMFLRAHVEFYPWVRKTGEVGVGLGLLYSYQGVNRKLPAEAGLAKSKGQQQEILLSIPMLFRPTPVWFTIQPSAMLGLGFYTGGDFWTANRRAKIPRSEYAFVAGGDLALCSAWDIVCVVGGAEYFVGVATYATETSTTGDDRRLVNPWAWHVGLGLDVMRIIARGNRVDSEP